MPRRLGVERKDGVNGVNVRILFNPLIWLKLKPHWFEKETRDSQKGLSGAGQGGIQCYKIIPRLYLRARSDCWLSGSHFHNLTDLGLQTVSLCCGSPTLSCTDQCLKLEAETDLG